MKTDNEMTRHDDGIVTILHDKVQFSRNTTPSTDADWKQLDTLARERFPHLTATLKKCETLSLQEWRTCILVRLGFRNGEIAILLRVSIQRITNIKAGANQKLFGTRSAISLARNMSKLDEHAQ